MNSPQALMSTAEVAQLLKLDPRTVQRQADAGQIPTAGKLPGATGAYIFNRADIETLVPTTPPLIVAPAGTVEGVSSTPQ